MLILSLLGLAHAVCAMDYREYFTDMSDSDSELDVFHVNLEDSQGINLGELEPTQANVAHLKEVVSDYFKLKKPFSLKWMRVEPVDLTHKNEASFFEALAEDWQTLRIISLPAPCPARRKPLNPATREPHRLETTLE